MKVKQSGFTIVELLIVIVVVGILAAISIAAYTGTQQRARDSARTTAVRQIQRALELYRVEHGRYPPQVAIATNAPPGFTGIWGTGYQYSVDTRDNWLQSLVSAGFASSIPKDPMNDNDHYFAYYASNSIGVCREPMYMLAVIGYERTENIPKDSKRLTCTDPGVTTADWQVSSDRAVFSNLSR